MPNGPYKKKCDMVQLLCIACIKEHEPKKKKLLQKRIYRPNSYSMNEWWECMISENAYISPFS